MLSFPCIRSKLQVERQLLSDLSELFLAVHCSNPSTYRRSSSAFHDTWSRLFIFHPDRKDDLNHPTSSSHIASLPHIHSGPQHAFLHRGVRGKRCGQTSWNVSIFTCAIFISGAFAELWYNTFCNGRPYDCSG